MKKNTKTYYTIKVVTEDISIKSIKVVSEQFNFSNSDDDYKDYYFETEQEAIDNLRDSINSWLRNQTNALLVDKSQLVKCVKHHSSRIDILASNINYLTLLKLKLYSPKAERVGR